MALALLGPTPPAEGRTRVVPTPAASIAAALAESGPGDTVLVEAGTYLEQDLALPAGVVVRGASRSDVVIDAQQSARHFTVAAGETPAELHGLTLRNGTARGRRDPDGGSVRLARDAAVRIRDCRFESSLAEHFGGAVYVARGGNLTLEDCEFVDATAHQIPPAGPPPKRQPMSRMSRGGAVHVDRGGTMFAERCRFTTTRAKDAGGAIYASPGAQAELSQCTFEDGESLEGGAVAADGAQVTLIDCTFVGNRATPAYRNPGNGGAVRLAGGGTGTLQGCEFRTNVGGAGGAVSAHRLDELRLENCRVLDNEAGCGGGVHAIATPTVILNSGFAGNVATKSPGGAVFVGTAPAEISASTFRDNVSAKPGSAVALFSDEKVTVSRCLMTGGQGAPVGGSPLPDLSCCNLFGNQPGDWTEELAAQAGSRHNVSANPRFVDGPNRFRLHPESPCLATGECGVIGMPPPEIVP